MCLPYLVLRTRIDTWAPWWPTLMSFPVPTPPNLMRWPRKTARNKVDHGYCRCWCSVRCIIVAASSGRTLGVVDKAETVRNEYKNEVVPWFDSWSLQDEQALAWSLIADYRWKSWIVLHLGENTSLISVRLLCPKSPMDRWTQVLPWK